jgi:hypothetical protein
LYRRFARAALAVLLPALAGTAGGCQLLGAIAYKASPPPTFKAQYVPSREPMVVFVQRSENPAEASRASDRIARLVTEDLTAHDVGPMVDPSAIIDLQGHPGGSSVWASRLDTRPTTRPINRTRTVAEVGRAVGATQVLYVDLATFSVEAAMGTEMVDARVEARVRVVDAETGQTRWPTDTTQGHALTVGTPYAKPGLKADEATVRERLCQDLATKVARLFYDWKSEGTDTGTPTE